MLPNIPPVEFPDASVEDDDEENMFPNMDVSFPDGSVVRFPDASVEEENGDERLNASLLDENNALIGVVPFKNDVIFILFQ
jgi:hypothetical protein